MLPKVICSVVALISTIRSQPEVVESLETRFLNAKARSDNTDLFRNFADNAEITGKAVSLQDEVNGHSMDNSLQLEGYAD